MALIPCPECGKQISDAALACPECAYPLAANEKKNAAAEQETRSPVATAPEDKPMGTFAKMLVVGGCLLVAFLVIGYIAGTSPAATEQFQKQDAIELCWKEQQRKSLEPGTQRFVARTCEMMEEQYTQKYGHRP